MNLVETLARDVGPRTAGSDEAGRAAEAVAAAFRELGIETRFQEFDLVGYEADEPLLEVDGERWPAGPCRTTWITFSASSRDDDCRRS